MKGLRALSEIVSRAGLAGKMGKSFGDRRDLYATLGYINNPDFDRYLSHYERGDIAAKIIDLPAKTVWRHPPLIRSEDERFVEAVEELDRRIRLFHNLQKVDQLSGIGEYGVLVLGTAGEPLTSDPAVRSDSAGDTGRLIYLQCYHQGSADINRWEDDSASVRFGLPAEYSIQASSRKGMMGQDILIPWTRTIHVAENTIEDQVHGTPRLKQSFNRLTDLDKVIGSASELFWLMVGGFIHADLDPEVSASATELEAFEQDMVEAMHGLRRILQTRGVTLERVSDGVPDPAGIYDALRQLIASSAEIPERILFGSERGELASSQDQREWHGRMAARQEQHVEPVILRPTLDRLVTLGILPSSEYEIEWQPLDAPTAEERATIADRMASAIQKMAPAGASDIVMPPWEFRGEVLGLPETPPEMPADFDDFGFDEQPAATPTPRATPGDDGADDLGADEDDIE